MENDEVRAAYALREVAVPVPAFFFLATPAATVYFVFMSMVEARCTCNLGVAAMERALGRCAPIT